MYISPLDVSRVTALSTPSRVTRDRQKLGICKTVAKLLFGLVVVRDDARAPGAPQTLPLPHRC